ncbi:MAG TPA: type II CRISPR-associated endonuclease Cas1 [Fibrobacteraceae bacterium]|nr:type II CRISPR-associated endonuclease Cas1 [Fibrobacteraceae bacterium]
MEGRILEVEKPGRYLRLFRGFCILEEKGKEIGRIALNDVESVIFHSHDGVISQQLLVELAERGIPLIVCDSRHMPVGIYWSLSKHHLTTARLAAQAELALPKRKQIWQQVVRAKIQNQAKVLEAMGEPCEELRRHARNVRSGDPENHEAQAAQLYWSRLFGDAFRRDPDGEGPNAFLNYGYAVLRATVVRAVVGCGLHPALGLHHHGSEDPTPLANDLMEPWRPVVDIAVLRLHRSHALELGPEEKAQLAEIINWDMVALQGRSPLRLCVQRMCNSLVEICMGQGTTLEIAAIPDVAEIRDGLGLS